MWCYLHVYRIIMIINYLFSATLLNVHIMFHTIYIVSNVYNTIRGPCHNTIGIRCILEHIYTIYCIGLFETKVLIVF